MVEKKSSHRKVLEKITFNPFKFEFKRIIVTAIEVNLFGSRGRCIIKSNLIFYDKKDL